MTTEQDMKDIAAQLRQPEGEAGLEVGKLMNEGNRILNEWCIQEIPLKRGDQVVEIGMGNGHFVQNVFTREAEITYHGCDFSETMIESAKTYNNNLVAEKKAFFHHTTGANLPFDDSSIDIIFSNNTVYFYEDPNVELSEYRRILKPEGALYLGIRPKSVMEKYPMTRYGFTMYEPEDLVKILDSNGYSATRYQIINEPSQEFNGETLEIVSCLVSGKA